MRHPSVPPKGLHCMYTSAQTAPSVPTNGRLGSSPSALGCVKSTRKSVRKARVVDEAVPGLALRHHLETPRDNASATSARWGQASQAHRSSTAAVLTDQCCGTQMRCGSRVPLSRSASWCHTSASGDSAGHERLPSESRAPLIFYMP